MDCTKPNERLRKVIDGIKFRYNIKSQKVICDELGGFSQTYLSDLLGGKYNITEDFSEKLREKFDVNPNYIHNGIEPIWIDGTKNITQIGNGTQVSGSNNHVTIPMTIDKALDEIAEQRKLVAKSQEQVTKAQELVTKSQEQIDRLISLLEKK